MGKASTKYRSTSGVALVEGTAAVAYLTLIAVFALSLLVNTAMAVYYKQKLGFVTNQASQFAASLRVWNHVYNLSMPQVRTHTTRAVNDMLRKMGMPAASRVTVVQEGRTIRTTVEVRGIAMPSRQTFLPAFIALSDSAVADIGHNQPPCFLVIRQDNHRETQIAVPSFGITPGGSIPGSTWSNHYKGFTFRLSSGLTFQEGKGPPTVMSPIEHYAQ